MTEAQPADDAEFPAAAGPEWSAGDPHGGVIYVGSQAADPWPPAAPPRPVVRRRVVLPVALFLATCASTFLGSSVFLWGGFGPQGLAYMAAVMAILLTHELGHFVQTLRYHVPASFPYFIPMPLSPLGTMGAVIGMQAGRADRRALFDIGVTGPLAGLLVAVPVYAYGILISDPAPDVIRPGTEIFHDPLVARWMIRWAHPELSPGQELYLNPLTMAGWVGMLITGLNMLPVSQLDGGHVAYALFGRAAHWLARGFVLVALGFIIISEQYMWLVMLGVVMWIGTDHPPTSNDRARLGWGRWLLGLAALTIPVFCLAPVPLTIVE